MSNFAVIALFDGGPHYSIRRFEEREAADRHVTGMIEALYTPDEEVEDGEARPLFDGNDVIVIVDDGGQPVFAWNRNSPKSTKDFDEVDFGKYLEDEADQAARRLIGFQFRSIDGDNIQGTDEVPFQLGPFDVLRDGAVLTAKGWADDNCCLVVEVFSGDIEEPTFVSEITLKEVASRPPAAR